VARTALITGISGQDGSYLAELLLGKGYEVHGLVRRSSSTNRSRMDHLQQPGHFSQTDGARLLLHDGDMTDSGGLEVLLKAIQPDELYNLAAQNVPVSFDQAVYTGDADGLGPVRLLDVIRTARMKTRFYQASSSEMFGLAAPPQRETTEFRPVSPYGVTKLYAHWMTVMYRQAYGLFCCSGILFNHESPRRDEGFVTRKITRGIAQILAGKLDRLRLGNLDSRRDWGHARDYVRAMWMMLQQPVADDYVIATGVSRSVKEFVEVAFALVGLDWARYVEVDKAYVRPADAPDLRGDPAKARTKLGWDPSMTFAELVREMVEHDLQLEGVDPIKHVHLPPAAPPRPISDRPVRP
jgi:GDPmannose 4,6-dehydratase